MNSGNVGQPVRLSLDRGVYFSDALFAIAMTLLAIELPVPAGGTDARLWESFTDGLDEEYVPFLISFAVISLFWFQHHRFFQHIARPSTGLLAVNLLCLLVVVVVPFATKVLGDVPEGVAFGTVLYAAVMVMWGLLYAVMVLTADRQGLWRPDAPADVARNMIVGSSAALAPFALSIPVALVAPGAAQYVWLLCFPAAVLTGRRIRPRSVGPDQAP